MKTILFRAPRHQPAGGGHRRRWHQRRPLCLLIALMAGACQTPDAPGPAAVLPPAGEPMVIRTASPASFAPILTGAVAVDATVAGGTLYLPAAPAGPVPAVIVADRLDGGEDGDDPYGPALAAAGIAVFRIDSRSGRGLAGPSAAAAPLSPAAATYDAFQALRLLAADPRFDRERIAVMGVGQGGAVALFTADDELRRRAVGDGLRFAAHLAAYPDCSLTADQPRPTARPIFLMLGETDDLAPSERCIDYAQKLGDAGAIVFAVVFRDQGHAFDSPQPAAFASDRLNRSRCDWGIAADGAIYDRASGVRAGEDFASFQARVLPACATRGGHAGAAGNGRQQALWEAYRFLSSALQPP